MSALAAFVAAILKALLPALFESMKDKSEDGHVDVKLRNGLRDRVRNSWGRSMKVVVLSGLIVMICSCGTRTIYVPDGTPVRLRETIPNTKVWVLDSEGKPVAGEMDLLEGWYALPVEPLPEDK